MPVGPVLPLAITVFLIGYNTTINLLAAQGYFGQVVIFLLMLNAIVVLLLQLGLMTMIWQQKWLLATLGLLFAFNVMQNGYVIRSYYYL